MEGSVTVHMSAPADRIWNLIADVRNTGRFSPEVFEAEWLDGATGPDFDRAFLVLMIQHHEGALMMVKDLFATPRAGQRPRR